MNGRGVLTIAQERIVEATVSGMPLQHGSVYLHSNQASEGPGIHPLC